MRGDASVSRRSPDAGVPKSSAFLSFTSTQISGILRLLHAAIFVPIFNYHYLDDLSRGRQGTFARRFLEESTGVYAVLLLPPAVLRVARYCVYQVNGLARGRKDRREPRRHAIKRAYPGFVGTSVPQRVGSCA